MKSILWKLICLALVLIILVSPMGPSPLEVGAQGAGCDENQVFGPLAPNETKTCHDDVVLGFSWININEKFGPTWLPQKIKYEWSFIGGQGKFCIKTPPGSGDSCEGTDLVYLDHNYSPGVGYFQDNGLSEYQVVKLPEWGNWSSVTSEIRIHYFQAQDPPDDTCDSAISYYSLGGSVDGRLDFLGDEDWQLLTANDPGDMAVFLDVPLEKNYQLEIWKDCATLIASSNQPSGVDESINVRVDPGTYWVHISGVDSGDYSIKTSFVPSQPEDITPPHVEFSAPVEDGIYYEIKASVHDAESGLEQVSSNVKINAVPVITEPKILTGTLEIDVNTPAFSPGTIEAVPITIHVTKDILYTNDGKKPWLGLWARDMAQKTIWCQYEWKETTCP